MLFFITTVYQQGDINYSYTQAFQKKHGGEHSIRLKVRYSSVINRLQTCPAQVLKTVKTELVERDSHKHLHQHLGLQMKVKHLHQHLGLQMKVN